MDYFPSHKNTKKVQLAKKKNQAKAYYKVKWEGGM